MTKKSILFTLLVGQTFLWTGSAFLSVLYRLYGVYAPVQALLFTEVLYYILQAAGIAAFALLLRRRPGIAGSRRFAAWSVAAAGVFTAIALLCKSAAVIAVSGGLMNLCVGLLSGVYLTRLASGVPQQCRGRVFGYSYAIGSVGSFLLSLPGGGTFLRTDGALWVFAGLVLISLALIRYLEPITVMPEEQPGLPRGDKKLILIALCVPLACSVVSGMGGYFTAADIPRMLNPAFPRAFYAVGLIAAGYINDTDRRMGAVCCAAALIFPFLGLALRHEVGLAVVLSIVSYIFYGFFSVYRVVLFADIAGKSSSLLPLAVFGLMAGRVGDALGTLGGAALSENQAVLICLNAVGFAAAILLVFALYQKLYMAPLPERQNTEALLNAYEGRYKFTPRQCEIFRLVVKGCSNAEISDQLFLAESTVKFHVKNILKLTGNANRTELAAHFKAGQ